METATKDMNSNEASSKVESPKAYHSILGTFVTELKWVNIIAITIFHLVSVWVLITFPYFQNIKLFLWAAFITLFSGFSITAGAHRLWTHRSYKAALPLRIYLMIWYSMTGMNSLYHWVRDHRVHHKFSETDADPHNIKRGFFFAHVGWLMMKKHPEVLRRGKSVDLSDILIDPVVQFHEKYFIPLKILLTFILPSIVPPLWWGQDWYWSIMIMCTTRYCLTVNAVWLVNSAAHLWGNKPYDKNMYPAENVAVSMVALGEGWHNYHHTFPWDYRTSELGRINMTAKYIDFFAMLGLATDLKVPSLEFVKQVVEKNGDGSHPIWGHAEVSENTDFSEKLK